MAKNLGREFATMDEDERRRFALERGAEREDQSQQELAFDDPRDPDTAERERSIRQPEEDDSARS